MTFSFSDDLASRTRRRKVAARERWVTLIQRAGEIEHQGAFGSLWVWRRNVVPEEKRKEYVHHFYGNAVANREERLAKLRAQAKRKIDSAQLCNFTALGKDTKHALLTYNPPGGIVPTYRNVYEKALKQDVMNMTEAEFAELVATDRRQPMAKIWSLDA